MTNILGKEMGQTITVRSITDTIDTDGKYTGGTQTTASKQAVISYITSEQDELVTAGRAKLGDARLYMEYDSGLEEEGEIVDQDGNIWRVVELRNVPEIYGENSEIHAIIRRTPSKA